MATQTTQKDDTTKVILTDAKAIPLSPTDTRDVEQTFQEAKDFRAL